MEKYRDQSLSFEERAADLVSRMTLEEKIGQTVYVSPAIERLGVPRYNWWNEALHGVARAGTATVFPQAIGLAATFDEELLRRVGDVISTEARAKFNANAKHGDRDIYKGLTFWSPNINIFRDPRWGRGHETYGEDPYLTSRLGVGFIKGLQGGGKYMKAAACAKHFAVHSGPEKERHEFDARVSPKELRETYLPAFKAAVTEAGVEAVMGAYNRTNGEPCCGSRPLLTDILRGEWGFNGHVTSDCWAVKDFHTGHMVTKTAPESVALAINNGCDLNCGNMYLNLMIAVNQGLVTEDTITRSVERLFAARMRLGLFDDPDGVPYNTISYLENDSKENNDFAEEVSRRGLALLKNNGVLPLDRAAVKTIAVIGPNADSRAALEGNYFGTASCYITALDGIRSEISPETRLIYAEGCHLYKDRDSELSQFAGDRLAEAEEAAGIADVCVVVAGLNALLEGEEGDASNTFDSGDKPDLKLPGLQEELIRRVCERCANTIVVCLSGSAIDLRLADEKASAVIQGFYPGARGGRALARLIFGDYSPSGKLPLTFYKTSEELPDIRDYSMYSGVGRTYRFYKGDPLYPFGYGLSYTVFEYSGLTAERSGGGVNVSVTLTNAGKRGGYETAQLYLSHADKRLDVPNWSLKGINTRYLDSGESARLSFTLGKETLCVFDEEGREVFDGGEVDIYVGGGQPDKRTEELTGRAALKTRV